MSTTKTFPAPQDYSKDKRPQITLTPVKSSQVAAIGYDKETKTLAVRFAHGVGAIYHYPGVSPETHEAFVKADSIGKFFGAHIKALAFTKYPPESTGRVAETTASVS